ncbi:glycosyltransferase family 9 protein [Ideonella dechloratans]|uniref:glycosyltransferase family 9 protein n=1 Tax=Ideonella dechloratans TaxID=36863 RepID=UPI0035AE6A67
MPVDDTPSPDTRPKTLVLHQFPGMGDLVWHVPYIRAIAAQSRGGRVAVLTAPSTFGRAILAGECCVSEVIDFDRRPRVSEGRKGRHAGLVGLFRMGRELRPQGFDRIVIFSDHVNRALMAIVAGIPERIGYGFTWLERCLLSHGPYIQGYEGTSVAVYRNATAMAVAHGFCSQPIVPKLQLPAQAVADQAALLQHLPRPLYTFAIGSSEPYKQWGAARFAALAEALADRGCGVVLLGGPAESGLAQDILARLTPALRDRVLGATGNTMLQSAATLALADANIGNDTGISNLAAALDRPSYVLLGNRPLLSHDPLMRMLLTPEPHIPASQRVRQPPVHLDRISVADVLARLETDQAPGFDVPPARPGGLRTALDLRGRPLDERLACCWWAQQRHLRTGEQFGLLEAEGASPDLASCFPATFTRLSAADLHGQGWSVWHPEPVWLKVRNVFAHHPVAGVFEAIPAQALAAARQLQDHAGPAPRVLVDLADASQRQTLLQALQDEGLQGVDVHTRFPGDEGSSGLMGEMLAATAWVGEGRGRDHLWALLRNGAPQIALVQEHPSQPDAAWATVQAGLGLTHPWDALPLNPQLVRCSAGPGPLPGTVLQQVVQACRAASPSPATVSAVSIGAS